MGTKRAVARNVSWVWAGMAVNLFAGFLVAPFLIRHLGQTNYGLWLLVSSFTGYFGLLDLGMRGAVGRHVAFFRAKKDPAGVNAILSTALLLLGCAGTVALIATAGVLVLFFRLFDVPPDQVDSARLALALVGLNVGVTLTLSIFDAALWAFQRFDLLNAIEISSTVIRLGLTFWLIPRGNGLVTLGLIIFGTTVVSEIVKGVLTFRLERGLRLRLRFVTREAARQLTGYGSWNLVQAVGKMAVNQSGLFIIGAFLGLPLVTPYGISRRLLGYASDLMATMADALTPVATALHAGEKHRQQQELFVAGGKYSLGLALFFLPLFLFLSRPLLRLWVGPELAWASQLLAILAIGEVLPMSQWITRGIVLGMGRPRSLALLAVAEIGLAIGLGLALLWWGGLVGMCVGFAVAATLCRGVFQMIHACQLVRVSLVTYVTQALLPALAAASLPALALAALVEWRSPADWFSLVLYGVIYAILYAAPWAALLGHRGLRMRGKGLRPEMGAEAVRDWGGGDQRAEPRRAPAEVLATGHKGTGNRV
jgi:O-antigen/teichoic acid export membrane protein